MSETNAAPHAAPRMEGMPLTFLSQAGPRPARRGAVDGFVIPVRLTSYRSLPLSCICEVRLVVDGIPVAPDGMALILDGNSHELGDLSDRTDLWWYILDFAELFFALPTALAPGRHELVGTLTTLVPFATGGRVTNSARGSVQFDIEAEERP